MSTITYYIVYSACLTAILAFLLYWFKIIKKFKYCFFWGALLKNMLDFYIVPDKYMHYHIPAQILVLSIFGCYMMYQYTRIVKGSYSYEDGELSKAQIKILTLLTAVTILLYILIF